MRQTARVIILSTAVGFLLWAALPGAAWAQAQTIQASNAWARRAGAMGSMDKMGSMGKMDKMGSDKSGMDAMSGGTGAVYVTLTNTGPTADALVAATSDDAQKAELHEVQRDGSVMKMRPVKSIPLA